MPLRLFLSLFGRIPSNSGAFRKWPGLLLAAFLPATAIGGQHHIILLHGLGRTSHSMGSLERALKAEGYRVRNVDYASRSASIATTSEAVISRAVSECQRDGAATIHFVTHSLGGILVRSYLARHELTNAGCIVMLGPPNQGSEVVDKLVSTKLFKLITGPAGGELGTAEESTPNALGPMTIPLGIIAGNRSINWINSLIIPGPDDGKVSVARTKVEGMTNHLVIPVTHPFLPRKQSVIQQTICFLRTGQFDHGMSGVRQDSSARAN